MAHYQGQQQVPIMQGPGQPVMRVVPQTTRPGFAHHSQCRLGILQIVCGMIVSIAAVMMYFFRASLFFFFYGIWTGVFFMIAGALAVQSAKSKNTCPIVGCLVMSIFSLLAASLVVLFGGIGLGMDSQQCMEDPDYRPYQDYTFCRDMKANRTVKIALQATNLLVGVFEWIVALIQMIICSRALCCAPSQPGTVYYTAAPQQVQVQQPQFQPQHAPQQQAYPHPAQYPQQYPQAGHPPPGHQPGHLPSGPYQPDQRGFSPPPYAQAPPPQNPSLYPQLPQMDDDGRPPPYNPSAPAPAYGSAS